MTNLLYISGLLTAFCGLFYVIKKKKKLSDENIVEFEKDVKPVVLKFLLLSFLPFFIIGIYLMNDPQEIDIKFFILSGLTSILFSVFGYIKSKKIIAQSQNAAHFKYILNYFIFTSITILLFLSASAYSLKDYWVY